MNINLESGAKKGKKVETGHVNLLHDASLIRWNFDTSDVEEFPDFFPPGDAAFTSASGTMLQFFNN